MALGLLWLSLTLLGALQTQASGTVHVARPLQTGLSRIRLQPNFKEDQFQGTWYALGVAENTIRNGSESEFSMYSNTFELSDDHSYKVTTRMKKGVVCDRWIRTLVPSYVPGQFELSDLKRYPGVQIYTVRVASTNYNQYAMLFLKMQFKDTFYYETTLYGRTKELNADLKDRFIDFATFIGFHEENIIFHVPISNGRLGRMGGCGGLSSPDAAPVQGTGRTKELSPELQELFISSAKSRGFTENNVILAVPTALLRQLRPDPGP
ncbi:neutrophil gelatinase-associated lipocalin [Fukomys damarensis]|uniref:neutrophil gelatinase-associated lipocalin n=1 Tax=Fukomys damarensis TaxID=885580 RepID=UPI0005400359|nr:neutrophil gelatinase-associated lipocalin [Fukomys damarensis]